MERRLITTDCHIAPPFNLVDELPESYRQYFPRLERREDGPYLVHPRNEAMMALGMDGSAGLKVDDSEAALARAAVGNVCPEAQPAFDAGAVLAELERDGVYGAVLIGRISAFDHATPPAADIAYCQIANDWLAETWAPYLDRAAPGIYLPYRDVAACVTELQRAASMGLRPALLPDGMWDRPYHLAEWEPLWEAANDLQIPFTMHVGGTRHPPNPQMGVYPGIADVSWYGLCCGMGETLGWMTYNGMFEKYPELHFVMTEGYAGWLAFAIQFFDHHWTDSRLHALGIGDSPASPKIDCPPSAYLKRQAHATFMWDPLAVRNRDLTGLDCLLWGNDYPHNEGSFPSSREWIDKQFAGVPEHEVDQMVRGNAAKLFRINV